LVGLCKQDYMSLCAAVMICATMVNIHTHKHRYTASDQLIWNAQPAELKLSVHTYYIYQHKQWAELVKILTYFAENNFWCKVFWCATQCPCSAFDPFCKPEVCDLQTMSAKCYFKVSPEWLATGELGKCLHSVFKWTDKIIICFVHRLRHKNLCSATSENGQYAARVT